MDGCPLCGAAVLALVNLTPSVADVTCGQCGRYVITSAARVELAGTGLDVSARAHIARIGGRPVIDADIVRRLQRPSR